MEKKKKVNKKYLILYKFIKHGLWLAFGYYSFQIALSLPNYMTFLVYSIGMILMIVLGMILKI
jgi:hypothetical protein